MAMSCTPARYLETQTFLALACGCGDPRLYQAILEALSSTLKGMQLVRDYRTRFIPVNFQSVGRGRSVAQIMYMYYYVD